MILLMMALSLAAQAAQPLVFIHGIKGSKLVDAAGETRWLTGWQALGFSGDTSLALPPSWQGDTQERDGLKASEVLGRVSVIPYLVEEKIYGPWLKEATELGHPFYPFAYDWRRDNLETLALYERFIEDVRAKNGGAKVHVVAHSMGGLITMALMNKRPELFASTVFVGVPFKGGIGFLVDMHTGVPTGLNRSILKPEVLYTFPSIYSLFGFGKDGLTEMSGAQIDVDFYSAADWARLKLGVFSRGGGDVKFLQKTLVRARQFRQAVQATRKDGYPPLLVVMGRVYPTLVTAVRGGERKIGDWDLGLAPREAGDGRVQESAAVPPAGVPHEIFETRAEHSQMLSDKAVVSKIRQFLAGP